MLRIVVAYAVMCSIWGTTWFAIKIGLRDLPPVCGAGVRFIVAGVFVWLLARLIRAEPGPAPSRRLVLILALTLFGGNYVLTYYAETGLASGLVAVLFGSLPFFVFGLSAVIEKERVGPLVVLGALLALAGVATISLASDTHAAVPYVLAALGASLLSAYANIELKRESSADPLRTMPPAMLLSGLAMTVAGGVFEHPDWARGASLSSLGAILYLGVLGSGVAFYLNHWLLRRLPTWVLGLSALIIPVIAVAIGALLGGEAFGPRELIGAGLVIAGVWLALRAPRDEAPATIQRRAAAAPRT